MTSTRLRVLLKPETRASCSDAGRGGEWTADGKLFVGELDGRQLRWINIAAASFFRPRVGALIYLQSPSENLGHYLRVVPGWVRQMKRAVDEAAR